MTEDFQLFQGYCLGFSERADRKPAQRHDMTEAAQYRAQIAGERSHIDALAGVDLKDGVISVRAIDEFDPRDVHGTRRQFHRAVGACQCVRPLTRHLDRREGRRNLLDLTLKAT